MTVPAWSDPIPRWRRLASYGVLALIATAITIVASAGHIPAVVHGNLVDPDSYMRLVRIRQGIDAGHLVNAVQRDDSGHLLVIEWSRLFDAVIVILAAPFAPFFGWTRALFWAGVATGPLSGGLLGAGLGFAAAPLTDRKWLWAAAVIGPVLPGIRGFNAFGVIHYHIAQVALAAITIGLVLRAGVGDRQMAWLAGISGGISIWLMPETMPFVMLAFGALGYAWLFRPIGGILARLGAGFAAMLWLALWIDPPHGGILVREIDRLSIVYAMLGLAVAATCCWLAGLDRMPRPGLRAILGVTGALATLGIWLSMFPAVALGPFGLVPAPVMKIFFGHMTETQPVRGYAEGTALLGPGMLVCGYALTRAVMARRTPVRRGVWLILASGIALAIGLTDRMVIFQQYPAAFAAGLAPVALHDISTRLARFPKWAAAARLALVWLPPLLLYVPAASAQAPSTRPAEVSKTCSMRHLNLLLHQAAGQVVLTRPADVPELLYRTRIIGVGSLYQHGWSGFARAWHAWRAPVGRVEPLALRATNARFILFCRSGTHLNSLATNASTNSLWNRLAFDHLPRWLRPVGTAADFELYKIRCPVPHEHNTQ